MFLTSWLVNFSVNLPWIFGFESEFTELIGLQDGAKEHIYT